MFTLSVIGLLILLAAGFSLYIRRAARARKPDDRELPPRSFDGLFPASDVDSSSGQSVVDTPSYLKAQLMDRARGGDLDTLSEAWRAGDRRFYRDVLDALIESASSTRESYLALVSQIANSDELRANKRLAELVMEEWKENADSASTGRLAHIAALSDDAATYERAVDLIVSYWKDGRLPQLSAEQLIEMVESQYWILADEARHGGEGFALKFKFVKLRRELAAATRVR